MLSFRNFIFLTVFLCGSAFASEQTVRFSKGGPSNFGVLVHNAKHTIYRSEGLGSDGLRKVAKYLNERNMPFPKLVIHMNVDGFRRTLFHPTLFALEEYDESFRYGFDFHHPFRRDSYTYLAKTKLYEAKDNMNRAKYLNSRALELFGFDESKVVVGGMESFYHILDLILQSEGPVLFHCSGGRHRTGTIALALRYLQGGKWKSGQRAASVTNRLLNAAQYEYFLHNPDMFEESNLDFVERWSKDPKFAEYVELYQESLNLPSLVH